MSTRGHKPPVVLRSSTADPKVFRWEIGGPVIGLLPAVDYQQEFFDLRAGDIVMLFADGIAESMNSQDEEWGEERLFAFARSCFGLSARESVNRIMDEAGEFASGALQQDDMN